MAHELQLEPAGLCDESLCSVLNVDLMLEASAVDIVEAARLNKVVDVRLVCQYAAEKVNSTDSVMVQMCMLSLMKIYWGCGAG